MPYTIEVLVKKILRIKFPTAPPRTSKGIHVDGRTFTNSGKAKMATRKTTILNKTVLLANILFIILFVYC